MKPFLRPVDRPLAPVGWEAERAGLWKGQEVEVVYDPNRHRVLVVRGELQHTTEEAMRAEGWKRQIHTYDNSLWVLDEVTVARERVTRDLDGLEHPCNPDWTPRPDRHPSRPEPTPPDLGGIA